MTIPKFRTTFEIIALEALEHYQHLGYHIIIPYWWSFEQQNQKNEEEGNNSDKNSGGSSGSNKKTKQKQKSNNNNNNHNTQTLVVTFHTTVGSLLSNFHLFFSSSKRPDRRCFPFSLIFRWVLGWFPGCKAVGAWSRPFTSISCWGRKWKGAIYLLHLYVFVSWTGTASSLCCP